VLRARARRRLLRPRPARGVIRACPRQGLRERLGEREVRLEAPGRKVACIVELAGVGHPLVNEDQESGSSERTLPPPLETPGFPREEERVPPDAGGWRLSL